MIQFFILSLLIVVLAGCATVENGSSRSAKEPYRVQLLGFASCPNTSAMEQRLKNALEQVGSEWQIEYIDQEKLAANDLRRGWPAPTILVDGRDLFGMASPRTPSMGCRMYAGPGGVPTVDELVQRLQRVGLQNGASSQ